MFRPTIMMLILACLATESLPVSASEKCSFFDRLAGKCEAEKEPTALDQVQLELDNAAYSSANFWYKLVEDYHTGTEEQRRAAGVLAERLFGDVAVLERRDPLQVRLYLRGFDTTAGELQVAILKDYAATYARLPETLKEGRRADFNFQRVTGMVPAVAPLDAGRAQSREEIARIISRNSRRFVSELSGLHRRIQDRQSRFEACNAAASSRDGLAVSAVAAAKYDQCMKDNVAELSGLLAGMVQPLLDQRELVVTDAATISVPWYGEPFVTVVIPRHQLAVHTELEIELVIHLTDDESKVVPEFAANPYEIPVAVMRQSPVIVSRRVDIGQGELQAETLSLAL